eukprot:2829258-Pyramimonas_sp.AAC.1
MRPPACVRNSKHSVSCSHMEPRRRPQWGRSHAPATPSTARRGSMGISNDCPSEAARMRPPHAAQ